MTSREEHVYLAKLCEQAERYDEMVQEMDHVAKAVRLSSLRAIEQRVGGCADSGLGPPRRRVRARLCFHRFPSPSCPSRSATCCPWRTRT